MEGRGSSGHSYSDLMSNSSDVTNGAMVMARNKYGFPQMHSFAATFDTAHCPSWRFDKEPV